MSRNITKIAVSALKVHPNNQDFFDDINGEQYDNFKKSIEEEGILTPLIVASDMTIISGHQRYRVAKELGIELVPVILEEDLINEDEKLKMLLACNFGRLKNDELKQRKVIAKYVELCGLKHGDNQWRCTTCPSKTIKEIAEELGKSERYVKEIVEFERNLTPEIKELVKEGKITRTTATRVWAKLSKEEQQEFLNELGIDKISDITQKETEKLVNELKQKEEQNELLQQKLNDLQNKENEVAKLKLQLEKLDESKNNKEIKTVEIEVIKEVVKEVDKQETLDKIKTLQDKNNKLESNVELSEKQFRELNADFEKKNKEVSELKNQINSLLSLENKNIEEYNTKLRNNSLSFCARVHDFFEKTAGLVWLSEHINEIPERERNQYLSAIELMENWVLAVKANLGIYLEN